MQVAAVWHDEYFGTVSQRHDDMPITATPLDIWQALTNINDREPQAIEDGYLEDWDAYGSHHKGMVTRIWWGPSSHEQAQETYERIIAEGAKPGD
jgi:hypothetical protein